MDIKLIPFDDKLYRRIYNNGWVFDVLNKKLVIHYYDKHFNDFLSIISNNIGIFKNVNWIKKEIDIYQDSFDWFLEKRKVKKNVSELFLNSIFKKDFLEMSPKIYPFEDFQNDELYTHVTNFQMAFEVVWWATAETFFERIQ